MTYEIYIASITSLEKSADKASEKLRALKGDAVGPMGLTPDSIKFSPEYQEALKAYNTLHNGIRKINSMVPKSFFKKRRDERRNSLS